MIDLAAKTGIDPEMLTDHLVVAQCSLHGEYHQEKLYNAGKLVHTSSCPTCLAEKLEEERAVAEKKKIEADARQKVRRIADRLCAANIPERFEDANFENYTLTNRSQKNCYTACKSYAIEFSRGRSMIMCGETGTGKTHLSTAIIKEVIEKHDKSAVYIRAEKLLREVKSTWGKNSDSTEDQIIRKYTYPDLMVIDEVGVQYGSDAEKLILFGVINERYEQVKSTILISNFKLDEIENFAGKRVIDRMKEGGGKIILFDWESARK